MRLGATRRGAVAWLGLLICTANSASAGLFHKAIPRETAGIDLSTGQQYYAPPIPYGHYAKDKAGYIHERIGLAKGAVGGLFHHGKACGACGGRGCGLCAGSGLAGNGGFLHGGGDPNGCTACGEGAGGFVETGHGGGHIQGGRRGGGHFHFHGGSSSAGYGTGRATVIEGPTLGTPQQSACGACGGRGCGLCRGKGSRFGGGGICGNCGGAGCGLCGKSGFGGGGICGNCGGAGCGLCGKSGFGGGICGNCGGAGCGLCKGLLSGLHGKLGAVKGALLGKLTHAGEVQYFVGPGGPVPITPGYVPYINVTRSPRDYFAFPPFADNVP